MYKMLHKAEQDTEEKGLKRGQRYDAALFTTDNVFPWSSQP